MLAVIVLGFIISDSVMHGAGLLMVTVAGLVMANMKDIRMLDIVSFKENLSIVIISILFILLGAEIDFGLFRTYWFALIEVFLFLQFVLRPAVVYLCTVGSKTTFAERFVMGAFHQGRLDIEASKYCTEMKPSFGDPALQRGSPALQLEGSAEAAHHGRNPA